jgi:hypothetical protein
MILLHMLGAAVSKMFIRKEIGITHYIQGWDVKKPFAANSTIRMCIMASEMIFQGMCRRVLSGTSPTIIGRRMFILHMLNQIRNYSDDSRERGGGARGERTALYALSLANRRSQGRQNGCVRLLVRRCCSRASLVPKGRSPQTTQTGI